MAAIGDFYVVRAQGVSISQGPCISFIRTMIWLVHRVHQIVDLADVELARVTRGLAMLCNCLDASFTNKLNRHSEGSVAQVSVLQ